VQTPIFQSPDLTLSESNVSYIPPIMQSPRTTVSNDIPYELQRVYSQEFLTPRHTPPNSPRQDSMLPHIPRNYQQNIPPLNSTITSLNSLRPSPRSGVTLPGEYQWQVESDSLKRSKSDLFDDKHYPHISPLSSPLSSPQSSHNKISLNDTISQLKGGSKLKKKNKLKGGMNGFYNY